MAHRITRAAALALSAALLTSCTPPLDTTITADIVLTPMAAPGQAELPPGVTEKAIVNNGRGTYLQTSIADDNPAMRYLPERADAVARSRYTPEMLQKAQQLIVRFIAEETLDSTINGGGDAEAWWTIHQGRFHPDTLDKIHDDLLAGKNVIQRELWQQEKYQGAYDYVYGASQSRIKARSIRPISLSAVKIGDLDAIRFHIDVTAQMKVKPNVGKVGSGVQYTVGPMLYDLALDSAGEWKIAGYESGATTLEG
jgi:hypothetical protein